MGKEQEEHLAKVMDVATNAGHIMLENGAEIFRVEETMDKITRQFGVDSARFFVLSNGIITSGGTTYSNVDFIPFKGTQLEKIVEVNRLSREISHGDYTLEQVSTRLDEIRSMKPKPYWEQLAGSAVGSAGFCAIFGGGFLDCIASFIAGLLLYMFILMPRRHGLSKVATNIIGSALSTTLCILFYKLGLGHSLGNMIIGAVIPLIPGVPFTNGIRDLANEDYIAGSTRMIDALAVFFCIAAGVALTFLADARIEGGMIHLSGMGTDSLTSAWSVQLLSAFFGTMGFAVLFGAPRDQYFPASICGTICWAVYLAVLRYTGASIIEATFAATVALALVSRFMAVDRKCPVTVFQICGLLPLIPGAGIFWTVYYILINQLSTAVTTGFTAIGMAIAIVMGLILINSLPGRLFKVSTRWR